jgi:putative hydrolase of the HAD superfamily
MLSMRASLPDALFFDAAGTLLTVAEPVGESYSRIAARHGIVATSQRVKEGFKIAWQQIPDPLHPQGQPPADDDQSWWRQLVASTFTYALGREPDASALEAAFQELYAHFAKPEAWVLYPDTRPALQQLYGRAQLLVLSNFDTRLLGLLDAFDLSGFFDHVLLSSQIGASKPHERMFHTALAAAALPAERCYHVGDDVVADAEGASRCGIPHWLVQRPGASLLDMVQQWI